MYGLAYHLGEGHVLKTKHAHGFGGVLAYHLGEGRVLKTHVALGVGVGVAYHLGEGRVLKVCPVQSPLWTGHMGYLRIIMDSRIIVGNRLLFSLATLGQLRAFLVSLSINDQLPFAML